MNYRIFVLLVLISGALLGSFAGKKMEKIFLSDDGKSFLKVIIEDFSITPNRLNTNTKIFLTKNFGHSDLLALENSYNLAERYRSFLKRQVRVRPDEFDGLTVGPGVWRCVDSDDSCVTLTFWRQLNSDINGRTSDIDKTIESVTAAFNVEMQELVQFWRSEVIEAARVDCKTPGGDKYCKALTAHATELGSPGLRFPTVEAKVSLPIIRISFLGWKIGGLIGLVLACIVIFVARNLIYIRERIFTR